MLSGGSPIRAKESQTRVFAVGRPAPGFSKPCLQKRRLRISAGYITFVIAPKRAIDHEPQVPNSRGHLKRLCHTRQRLAHAFSGGLPGPSRLLKFALFGVA